MEAKDLMVGDLVYNHRNWECPIIEIHKNSAVVFARHYGEEAFLLSDLRPIPLTPEILEKNGFKCDAHPNYICDSYFIDGMTLLDFRAGYFKYSTITIEYVHQLQHLLKLCNIKKEIKL